MCVLLSLNPSRFFLSIYLFIASPDVRATTVVVNKSLPPPTLYSSRFPYVDLAAWHTVHKQGIKKEILRDMMNTRPSRVVIWAICLLTSMSTGVAWRLAGVQWRRSVGTALHLVGCSHLPPRASLSLRSSGGEGDAPDYEAILEQIASDKRAQLENAELEEQERKRQVLKRRKDKEYNAYWEREENKGKGSKDLATLRSYYAGKNGTSAGTAIGEGDERWDFQDVPMSPRAGAVSTLGLGLALLAGLVAAKKLTGGEQQPVVRKKKRVRNAINMPGVGIITVD